MGQIESGVRVSVSFQQKYPPGSVLRCPTAAENGGYDQRRLTSLRLYRITSTRRARHKHFVVLLCEQRTTDAAVSARRLPPFVAALFFHTSRLVWLTTLQTCMQRSQIFVQNRVFCLLHLHSTPPLRRRVLVGISPPRLVWKN